jgi:hypothetical protein
MVRKYQKSSWQPTSWPSGNQLDILEGEVRALYTPQVMKTIIAAARLKKITSNTTKQAKLAKVIEQNIINLGIWIKSTSNLTRRPLPAQRKAALKKVAKAANTLKDILKALDGDSSDDLRWAIMSDLERNKILFTDPEYNAPHRLEGYIKFQALLNVVSKLEQWSQIAQKKTLKPKDGNRRADVKRQFTEGLIQIWILIGHKKPTVTSRSDYKVHGTSGALMEFTKAAASPLGLEPMEGALRQAIAQWKKTGLEPPHEIP